MKIEHPSSVSIPDLRVLWKEAFGDTDAFLDLFFSTAYDPCRCRCVTEQSRITAALYWMDCCLEDQKFAYIYAVATASDCRGRGLCKQLMEDTATLLRTEGYSGTILVPQSEGLRTMYGRMGYRHAAPIDEFFCAAAELPVSVREITAESYAALRCAFTPGGSLQPGSEALAFLDATARFYTGDGFIAAVSLEPAHLRILEHLGSRSNISGLIAALGATEATVRTPGNNIPFAMYLPLTADCRTPEYYPFAFD